VKTDDLDRRYQKLTPAEARKSGQRVYWGRSCPRGHPGWRYTVGGQCVICESHRTKSRYDCSAADARRKAEALRDERDLRALMES
jgi:hypothetical protein